MLKSEARRTDIQICDHNTATGASVNESTYSQIHGESFSMIPSNKSLP